jgi:hypothetical protein
VPRRELFSSQNRRSAGCYMSWSIDSQVWLRVRHTWLASELSLRKAPLVATRVAEAYSACCPLPLPLLSSGPSLCMFVSFSIRESIQYHHLDRRRAAPLAAEVQHFREFSCYWVARAARTKLMQLAAA